ncbi:MAG TPA: TRAP transporter large permease [Clostridia bacterium]|nr:TRAP transporter large permease [Clostridia bacterium]
MLTVLVVVLLVCFVFNIPIGFALGVASIGSLLAGGNPDQLIMVPQRIVASMNSFPLLAIPLFMVAGSVMEIGGVSKRIVTAASSLIGHIRGGLASVSIMACTFFAAISGSTPATAAAIGSLTIPEMRQRGYPDDYSSAVVAASSCLGVVIPPSITMVVFGVTGNISIGKMLIGGVIPGLLIASMLIATNVYFSRKADFPTEPKESRKQRLTALKEAFWALMMPVIILAGIMSGVFTPTESAAVAVVYGLIVSLFIYKEMSLKDLVPVFYKAALNSAMIMLLIGTAGPFGWIMTVQDVPNMVSTAILSISDNYYVIFSLVLLIYLILGTFMETAAIIMLTVPILTPIMVNIGADMVHYGVVSVIALAIGMATPPVGIALFATCGVSKVTMAQISKQIWPFLLVMILALFVLMLVPQIVTFLPNLMMG